MHTADVCSRLGTNGPPVPGHLAVLATPGRRGATPLPGKRGATLRTITRLPRPLGQS